jgi:hypothetical protein
MCRKNKRRRRRHRGLATRLGWQRYKIQRGMYRHVAGRFPFPSTRNGVNSGDAVVFQPTDAESGHQRWTWQEQEQELGAMAQTDKFERSQPKLKQRR